MRMSIPQGVPAGHPGASRAYPPAAIQMPAWGTHSSLDGVDGLAVPICGHVVVPQGQVEVTLKVCLNLQ